MTRFLSGVLSCVSGFDRFSNREPEKLRSAFYTSILEVIDIFVSHGIGKRIEWEKTLAHVCRDGEAVTEYRQLLEYIERETNRNRLLKMVALEGGKVSGAKYNKAL